MTMFISLSLLLGLTGLAYWHRDRWLYILAGLGAIAFGATYVSSNLYIGFIVILFGVYNFFKAFWDRRAG